MKKLVLCLFLIYPSVLYAQTFVGISADGPKTLNDRPIVGTMRELGAKVVLPSFDPIKQTLGQIVLDPIATDSPVIFYVEGHSNEAKVISDSENSLRGSQCDIKGLLNNNLEGVSEVILLFSMCHVNVEKYAKLLQGKEYFIFSDSSGETKGISDYVSYLLSFSSQDFFSKLESPEKIALMEKVLRLSLYINSLYHLEVIEGYGAKPSIKTNKDVSPITNEEFSFLWDFFTQKKIPENIRNKVYFKQTNHLLSALVLYNYMHQVISPETINSSLAKLFPPLQHGIDAFRSFDGEIFWKNRYEYEKKGLLVQELNRSLNTLQNTNATSSERFGAVFMVLSQINDAQVAEAFLEKTPVEPLQDYQKAFLKEYCEASWKDKISLKKFFGLEKGVLGFRNGRVEAQIKRAVKDIIQESAQKSLIELVLPALAKVLNHLVPKIKSTNILEYLFLAMRLYHHPQDHLFSRLQKALFELNSFFGIKNITNIEDKLHERLTPEQAIERLNYLKVIPEKGPFEEVEVVRPTQKQIIEEEQRDAENSGGETRDARVELDSAENKLKTLIQDYQEAIKNFKNSSSQEQQEFIDDFLVKFERVKKEVSPREIIEAMIYLAEIIKLDEVLKQRQGQPWGKRYLAQVKKSFSHFFIALISTEIVMSFYHEGLDPEAFLRNISGVLHDWPHHVITFALFSFSGGTTAATVYTFAQIIAPKLLASHALEGHIYETLMLYNTPREFSHALRGFSGSFSLMALSFLAGTMATEYLLGDSSLEEGYWSRVIFSLETFLSASFAVRTSLGGLARVFHRLKFLRNFARGSGAWGIALLTLELSLQRIFAENYTQGKLMITQRDQMIKDFRLFKYCLRDEGKLGMTPLCQSLKDTDFNGSGEFLDYMGRNTLYGAYFITPDIGIFQMQEFIQEERNALLQGEYLISGVVPTEESLNLYIRDDDAFGLHLQAYQQREEELLRRVNKEKEKALTAMALPQEMQDFFKNNFIQVFGKFFWGNQTEKAAIYVTMAQEKVFQDSGVDEFIHQGTLDQDRCSLGRPLRFVTHKCFDYLGGYYDVAGYLKILAAQIRSLDKVRQDLAGKNFTGRREAAESAPFPDQKKIEEYRRGENRQALLTTWIIYLGDLMKETWSRYEAYTDRGDKHQNMAYSASSMEEKVVFMAPMMKESLVGEKHFLRGNGLAYPGMGEWAQVVYRTELGESDVSAREKTLSQEFFNGLEQKTLRLLGPTLENYKSLVKGDTENVEACHLTKSLEVCHLESLEKERNQQIIAFIHGLGAFCVMQNISLQECTVARYRQEEVEFNKIIPLQEEQKSKLLEQLHGVLSVSVERENFNNNVCSFEDTSCSWNKFSENKEFYEKYPLIIHTLLVDRKTLKLRTLYRKPQKGEFLLLDEKRFQEMLNLTFSAYRETSQE